MIKIPSPPPPVLIGKHGERLYFPFRSRPRQAPVFAAALQDPQPKMPRTISQLMLTAEVQGLRFSGTRAARRNQARQLFREICKRRIDVAGNGRYLEAVRAERTSFFRALAERVMKFRNMEAVELQRMKTRSLAA